MFYEFASELSHASRRLPIIWEVETALAAVLTEANESERPLIAADIGPQARALLTRPNLPSEMHAEYCVELEHVLDSGHAAFQMLAARLTKGSERDVFRAALKPDGDRILAGINADREFATYLQESNERKKQNAQSA